MCGFFRCFLFLLGLFASLFSVNATHAALLGSPCNAESEVGMTRIDTDGANIIGCLWDDASHKVAQWKSVSFSNTTLNCLNGQVLVRVVNGAPVCAQLTPYVVGGAELVSEAHTNIFGFCRLAWGSVQSCNETGIVCSRGKPIITGYALDAISSADDQSFDKFISLGSNGARVAHINCVAE